MRVVPLSLASWLLACVELDVEGEASWDPDLAGLLVVSPISDIRDAVYRMPLGRKPTDIEWTVDNVVRHGLLAFAATIEPRRAGEGGYRFGAFPPAIPRHLFLDLIHGTSVVSDAELRGALIERCAMIACAVSRFGLGY